MITSFEGTDGHDGSIAGKELRASLKHQQPQHEIPSPFSGIYLSIYNYLSSVLVYSYV